MSDVERNVWMRTLGAPFKASQARSMSSGRARARLQIVGPSTSCAMRRTASKSPGELYAKPASMMSTPSRASCLATITFSSTFMLAPGDCSPSRNVVSKILIMRVIVSPLLYPKTQKPSSLSCVQGRRLDALRGTTLVRC